MQNFVDVLEQMSPSDSFIRSLRHPLIQKLSYGENSDGALVRNVFADGNDSYFAGSFEEKLR